MLSIKTITVVLVVALMLGVAGASACRPIETEAPETLTIAFLPQEDPEKLLIEAEKIADFLSQRIGVPVKAIVPLEYAAVVEALRGGHAQIAFLSARPAVLAHEMADAWIILGEIRRGKTYYYSQWYVRKDSGIETLRDLEGKTVAFSSPTSTSGYLCPIAKLVEGGLLERGKADPKALFREVIFSGGYQQSLLALSRGEVDAAGASDYAFELYLTPEERQQIKVIAKQGPVPVHGVAVLGSLPYSMVTRIQEALLEFNKPENLPLLKELYGAEGFVPVTHSEHIGPVHKAAELTGFGWPAK